MGFMGARDGPPGLMAHGPTTCHIFSGTLVCAHGLRPVIERGWCPPGRAREGKDAMTEISVKTKLWGLIAVMLLLIISVGGVGFVTLDRGAATLKEFVDQDEALQNLTGQVHLHIIQLRRFEKDYFLNIGHPEKQQEYLKKYQEIDAAVPQLMGNLAILARTDVHLPQDLKAKVAALPALYADYRGGFYDTVRRLKNDPNLTPQQANVSMGKFKAGIPILEADMAAVAEAVDRMEISVSAQAVKRAQDARRVIAVVVLAALVLAGLLGAALGRSIHRAIFREGVRRMAHRI
jgi:methyl-accepting chemotaxis protein